MGKCVGVRVMWESVCVRKYRDVRSRGAKEKCNKNINSIPH